MAAGAEPILAGDFPPATDQDWRDAVDKVLRGKPFSSLVSHTADGIEVQPLYVDGPDESVTGTPGAAPHTRSFVATARPGGMWDVRAEVELDDPSAANALVLRELERGSTSLLLGGGTLAGEATLSRVLDGVLLDLAPVVLGPGDAFLATAEWLMELWAGAGVADADVRGGFGADPIGTLARTGTLSQGVQRALADTAGLAAMTATRYPGVRALTVDATPYAEAGASEAQELAAMLSTAVAYMRCLEAAGVDAAAAGRQFEVVLGGDADVFTTIAKVRAARRLWSSVATACGIDPGSSSPSITVRTLDRVLSRRDPWVNMLRVTAAAFAAATAGADTIVTRPFDSAVGEPGELGRRMARNTQLLLGEESGVGRVVDPAGGSWYVESLTESLASEAWDLFRVLEGGGGLPGVLMDGTLPARIAAVRDERFAEVDHRRRPITGVSEFPDIAEAPLTEATTGTRLRATEPVAGTAELCAPLPRIRWAERFEVLRDAADAAADAAGSRPEVFLANLGPVATHTARATWARNFFAAGGIAAVTSAAGGTTGFGDAAAVASDFVASGARIVCICSSDGRYAEMATPVATALREAGAQRVYLAGDPGEHRDEWTVAGVDEFVHVGVDVVASLRRAHEVLGIAPADGTEAS